MINFSKRQILTTILLSILFGGISLIGLGSSDIGYDPNIMNLRYFLVGMSCLLLIMLARFRLGKFNDRAFPFIALWTSFSIVLIISGLANNDSTIVRDGFWFAIGIPLVFFNALPHLMKENANITIAIAILLGHLPYIIISLLFYPFENILYQGVFANSNQLGMTCTATSAGVFVLLIAALNAKKKTTYTYCYFLLLLGNFILIFLSKSRTSLIAFFVIFAIFIWRMFKSDKRYMKHLFIILFVVITAVSLVFLFAGEQSQIIWANVYSSFTEKEEYGGFDSRETIWLKTLEDMSLLGHGYNYFDSNFGLGGHNTVIDVLGRNGIIAAYLLFFLAIASFTYTYHYLKDYAEEDKYAVFPLLMTTCFWVFSMSEGMFGSLGNSVTIAYMLSVGVVLAKIR
ncbi:O-antigen ligase family protein [Chroococcidiopsis sp. FACHB-1243]|uniref:O-antigen ligase family protein n=1 Tax=Chroococcidiopsis sp. [FACHB-1243] TaxID=2692781 RepID=UPI00177DA823|nr:O-antigen ligase family protein [Chroococcidiopsis sp. [FACHB-1243]]MBD2308799.1 O-antigen ligase family protein [Chroococcidiopsis sp. [FACHB-1243]]